MAPDKSTKAQRWLDLIACLLGRRRPVGVETIFAEVPGYGGESGADPESVRRRFERDKEELRELGIPIDTIDDGSGTHAGYLLRTGALHLPLVRIIGEASGERRGPAAAEAFTREEMDLAIQALAEAADIAESPFAAEARTALQKLTFDIGPVAPGSPIVRAAAEDGLELRGALAPLYGALRQRKRVEFRYHGLARGEPTDRVVDPYGLVMEHGAWYLIGHDHLREAVRMFHVRRMEGMVVQKASSKSADFDLPADFDLSEYRNRRPWELQSDDEPVSVLVEFVYPLSLWADRHDLGTLESSEDGSAVRRIEVRHLRPFFSWILGMEGAARIVEPVALEADLRAIASEIAEAHA